MLRQILARVRAVRLHAAIYGQGLSVQMAFQRACDLVFWEGSGLECTLIPFLGGLGSRKPLKAKTEGVLGQLCPVVPLFPFWGGLGFLINPFQHKRAPFLILGYWAT